MNDWRSVYPATTHGSTPGGYCGTQISDPWEVRWTRPVTDGGATVHAVVTRYYYTAATPGDGTRRPTHVECQTEYLICTDQHDPGGTELWAASSYREVPDTRGNPTTDDAYRAALQAQPPDAKEWDDYGKWWTLLGGGA